MAVEIRPTSTATTFSDGDFTNPLCFTFDGTMGGKQETQLYLKNISGGSTDIEIEITGGTTPAPYTVYLKKTEADDWSESPIAFQSVSSNATETFFMKIEMDPDTEVKNFTNLKIQVTETAP